MREVYEALYRGGGGSEGAGTGESSTGLLGTIFHEVFTALIGPDTSVNLDAAWSELDAEAEGRRRALLRHVYDRLIGPRLRHEQAHLHHVSAQVLTFWHAIEALCDWLVDLKRTGSVIALSEPLSQEWRDPSWSGAVRLVSVPNAIVRLPGSGRWCVVELKLGRTVPGAYIC
jgi:hypothetical protein